MNRLDTVIEQVKSMRRMDKRFKPWIYDDNGNIRNDVICGDVLEFLEELKDYEINVNDRTMESILYHANSSGYTYNCNGNVDCAIAWKFKNLEDGGCIAAICVHLYGDARGGFSNWLVCKFEYDTQLFELESANQHKYINDRYITDICLFSECYNVYDMEKNDDVGDFYAIEVADLLKEIEKQEKEKESK